MQRQFDFDRVEQQYLLDQMRVVLPKIVRADHAALMCDVLDVIYDYSQLRDKIAWISIPEIAKNVAERRERDGREPRGASAVGNALDRLRSRETPLVASGTIRRGRSSSSSTWAIVWHELKTLVEQQKDPTGRSGNLSGRSGNLSGRSGNLSLISCQRVGVEEEEEEEEIRKQQQLVALQTQERNRSERVVVVSLDLESGNPDPIHRPRRTAKPHVDADPRPQPNCARTKPPEIDKLETELGKLQVDFRHKALALARRRGLSDEEIEQRIEQWKADTTTGKRPSWLYNWLADESSYRSHMNRIRNSEAAPAFKFDDSGLSGTDLAYRSGHIAWGKKQGWSHDKMQAEITACESWLRAGRPVLETRKPKPQTLNPIGADTDEHCKQTSQTEN